jgi:uncharacterized protein YcfJ
MSRLIGCVAAALLAAFVLPPQAAAQSSHLAWADVIEAQPVRQQVRSPEYEDVCWDEQVYHAAPARRSATPKIFGAIIGGVIGNQFGGGSGKDLMTVAGAALGASVAADQQRRKYPDRYYASTEQRCETQKRWRVEERIVAWDVTYELHGQTYQARMQDAPGDRIQVRVGVQPVGKAAY